MHEIGGLYFKLKLKTNIFYAQVVHLNIMEGRSGGLASNIRELSSLLWSWHA